LAILLLAPALPALLFRALPLLAYVSNGSLAPLIEDNGVQPPTPAEHGGRSYRKMQHNLEQPAVNVTLFFSAFFLPRTPNRPALIWTARSATESAAGLRPAAPPVCGVARTFDHT